MRRLHDNPHRLSERTGLALTPFAQQADVDRSILSCTGRPSRGSDAWKIARAYAATTNISPEAADAQIIVVIN
jgi:CHASE2 domain-containing sensor protein